MAKRIETKKAGVLSKEISFKGLFSRNKEGAITEAPTKSNVASDVDPATFSFTPSLPEVNVLPEYVQEEHAARDMRVRFAKGLGLLVFVFVALYGISFITDSFNRARIDTIQADTQAINQQLTQLNTYGLYKTQIETKRQALATQMKNDINYDDITKNFNAAATNAGFSITKFSVTSNATSAATSPGQPAPPSSTGCQNPDPFSSASGIGCISFNLKSNGDGSSLAKFFSDLGAKDSGFVNVFVPNTSPGGSSGTSSEGIEGTVAFTDKFYTKKYESFNETIDSVLAKAGER